MKSVIIKTLDDFGKITEDTSEIEFVEYNDVFSFADDCILPSITFTKMYIELDILPKSVEKLCLFDCDADIEKLGTFSKLKYLAVTNKKIDILDIINISNLEKLSLNFCEISNIDMLDKFSNLKELSLIETNIVDYNFLNNISCLKKVIIDDDNYEKNKEFFYELGTMGIVICDMMGGNLNEV